MSGTYVLRKGVSRIQDLKGGLGALGVGIGNIYYVMQTSQAFYSTFVDEYQDTYADGSNIVHTTIQSALNATVAERGDYVIVMPDASDYDISSALTMSKSHVHLICPAGLGTNGFPTNAARIHQNDSDSSSYHIVVTADCVEIAGLFLKSDSTSRYSQIFLSGTRWHPVIHDCFFGMSATANTNNNGIYADGACSHFSIYNNYFTNYNPGANTSTNNNITAFINISAAGSTRGLIRNNIMHTGVNTTVATAINAAGYGIFIIGNYLWEDAAFAGVDAGILTVAINASVDCFVAENRVGIATPANAVDGGTNAKSFVLNFTGAGGGTQTSDS